MRTLVWRGLDAVRLEICYAEVRDGELAARGTQIGAEPEPYELRYELAADHLHVEILGGRSLELSLGGRDYFDLGLSPLFNSLPVLRHALHRGGDARNFTMAWVAVPSLEVNASDQRYEPVRPGVVRYRGSHRADAPHFDLEFDDDGFVVRYPGLAERVG